MRNDALFIDYIIAEIELYADTNKLNKNTTVYGIGENLKDYAESKKTNVAQQATIEKFKVQILKKAGVLASLDKAKQWGVNQ